MLGSVNLVLRTRSRILANHKIAPLLYRRPPPFATSCNTKLTTMASSATSPNIAPTTGSTSQPQIAFISGHMELTPIQFETHYVPPITHALSLGHHFIVGDASGLDTIALNYLLSQTMTYPDLPSRVTVYYSRNLSLPKLHALGVNTVAPALPKKHGRGGGSALRFSGVQRMKHITRDAAMTAASDYDILWVRSDEEARELYGAKFRPRVSATELNRSRRIEKDGGLEKEEEGSRLRRLEREYVTGSVKIAPVGEQDELEKTGYVVVTEQDWKEEA